MMRARVVAQVGGAKKIIIRGGQAAVQDASSRSEGEGETREGAIRAEKRRWWGVAHRGRIGPWPVLIIFDDTFVTGGLKALAAFVDQSLYLD